ncbi:hypothetical protein O4J56_29780, partial [Nocardiopsis sp. RSe5-2]
PEFPEIIAEGASRAAHTGHIGRRERGSGILCREIDAFWRIRRRFHHPIRPRAPSPAPSAMISTGVLPKPPE